jgi:5-methylcytosine-specific restriction endonuclease McrA
VNDILFQIDLLRRRTHMPEKRTPTAERVIAAARRDRQQREAGYRERALKLFPHVCARCGRELTGKRLRELTVHHKDHDHDHNPPDGSNWELLCIYCHENEHARETDAAAGGDAHGHGPETTATHRPFADLAALLKTKK